jgi:multiple sugar transport system substrate-binding protein
VTLEVYRHKGKLYSLPIECGGHVIYFNKELFEQAGETTPDKLVTDGKWTWDQLITTARPLTKTPDQFGYAVWRAGQMNIYAWSFGGGFVDKEREPTKSLWDQPAAQRALQYWVDLRDKHGVRPTQGWEQTYGGSGAVAVQMASGKLAMAVQGAWERLFLKDVTFKYDIAVMPKGDRLATEGYSSACVGTAASKDKDTTWQWIKFTGGEDGQKIYAGLISVPPLRRVAESDWFLTKPPVNNKVYLDALNTARPQIGFPEVSEYNDIVTPVLDLVDAGKLGVAEACQRIHKQLKEELFTGA